MCGAESPVKVVECLGFFQRQPPPTHTPHFLGLWGVVAACGACQQQGCEHGGWLASGTLLYMAEGFTVHWEKMRIDKEHTHTHTKTFLATAPLPPQKTQERRQSRHVALSRPVAAVNAPMLTAICRTEFVIKGKHLSESTILSLFLFFFPSSSISQRDTNTHTRTQADSYRLKLPVHSK